MQGVLMYNREKLWEENCMADTPRYLYHYTSINTLGFILKDKRFRFNSLENMDDLDESTIWNKKFGKYCFVSCWTSEEKESIPMWKMYSNDLRGVRIRLPIKPFKVYLFENKKYIVDPNKFQDDNFFFSKATEGSFLRKVIYVPIEQADRIKNGDIGKKRYEYFGYDELELGQYKSDFWEFQEEWRYHLFTVPTRKKNDFDQETRDIEYIETLPDLSIKDVYLDLDEEKIKQMEITLGPKTNEIDCLFVEMLVDKYNPGIKILNSELKGRI